MNPSLKYALVILIILLLVWWFLKTKEHFEQCNGVKKNHEYQYKENPNGSCKDNCECKGILVCKTGKCVVP
jgi:hypothetical protein